MNDWLMLILLGAIEITLKFVTPFNRFVGEDMMFDLKYPLKSNTVPFWAVQITAVLLPIAIFSVYYYNRRDVYDFHHATLGLLYSVLITGVITNVIKDAVGRPRPDFYWRCFPDGKPEYDPLKGNAICHGESSVITEGHRSFPSGHTSWSFGGLGFLAWYLSGKIRVFDHQGHVAKLCLVIFPLLVAALVGISRVNDYRHHWQDVFVGGFIGLIIASFCYSQFFPPPNDPYGWGPYAYFQMLEESRDASVHSPTNTNQNSEHSTENECVYIPPRCCGDSVKTSETSA